MTQAGIQTGRYVWFKRNPGAHERVPFEWDEPAYGGKHVAGEIVVARAAGTSGNLTSGLWRAASTSLAGYSHGHHITWTSKGPFVKKFWTITMDQIPALGES